MGLCPIVITQFSLVIFMGGVKSTHYALFVKSVALTPPGHHPQAISNQTIQADIIKLIKTYRKENTGQ